MPSSRSEEWQPLVLYRNSLLHGETDQAPVAPRRAYTRKRRDHGKEMNIYLTKPIFKLCNLFIDEDDEEEEDDEEHNDPDYRG